MRPSIFEHVDMKTILVALGVAALVAACGETALPQGEDIEEISLPSQNMGADETDSSETDTVDSGDSADAADAGDAADAADAGDETDGTPADETDATDTSDQAEPEPQVTVVDYVMNDQDSLLYAQVWKDDTLLAGFAHDHVIRATEWVGTLTYDPQDLSSCAIAFELPVDAMRNDEPAMREFVGLDGEINGGDRETIRENMTSGDQLDVENYPTISFSSTSCEGAGGSDGELIVSGGLTVRGVTKNLTVPVNYQIRDGKFYVQGTIDAIHSDFGMEPYSAFFGSVKTADAIQMNFDMVALPE